MRTNDAPWRRLAQGRRRVESVGRSTKEFEHVGLIARRVLAELFTTPRATHWAPAPTPIGSRSHLRTPR
jgi:hypothetical protein